MIQFELPQADRVSLEIVDVAGRRAGLLLDDVSLRPGAHEIVFNAAGLRAGLYFARLRAGSRHASRKVVVLE